MKLKGRDWGFIGVAAAVVLGLGVLSHFGKTAIPMSNGAYHAGLTTASKRADCMVCHDPNRPDATSPLKAGHPLAWRKEELACTTCHVPSTKVASRVFPASPARVPVFSSTAQFCFTSR